MKLDSVFSGIGGQGIVALSDIFCEAAMFDGFDVAKAEIHGMAQRGGSIVAYARIGEKIESPLIEYGRGDVILGFEMLETARVLPMLKEGGTVVMNAKYIPPTCTLSGSAELKEPEDLVSLIRKKALKVHEIEGESIATKLGNVLVVNTVLLGAFSALPENPVNPDSYRKAIAMRFKQKYVDLNLRAFQLGRESVTLG